MRVPLKQSVPSRSDVGGDDDGDDQTVNAENARHDWRDDGFHHELWSHHPHARDPNARLGRPVRRAYVCKHQRARGAHETKKRRHGVAAGIIVGLRERSFSPAAYE